jgi:cytoskeletal protein CcmA (bactofilin family)
MLGKSKKTNNLRNDERSLKEKSFDPNASPAISPAVSGEKTSIGENISIKGSIRGKGDLVIKGTVKGDIDLDKHHLTVGPTGKVEAEIRAEHVTISGRLSGNINALGKVEITKTAEFSGEIKAKRISVEDGAYLKAVIELQREPQPGNLSTPVTLPTKRPADEKEKSDLKPSPAKGN